MSRRLGVHQRPLDTIPIDMGHLKLPTGTVTFMFTDIEGSTSLAKSLGATWPEQLDTHAAILRGTVADAGGYEVSTSGDSFFFVFEKAGDALRAAVAGQELLEQSPWPETGRLRVRIGLHTGTGEVRGEAHDGTEDYVGLDVHQAARIEDAAHGGQVVLSEATKALVSDTLPGSVELRDLGQHSLRGIDYPVRLYQAVIPGLQEHFPHLRTLTAPIRLPEQLTSLIGREKEIAEAVSLLEESRLVTLTGPGGTGKTRLSIAVALEAAPRFRDGVFFIALSAVSDPDLVASTILGQIGVTESGGMPEARLVEHLADREMLLVLDNFEQVVEAAPLVTRLLGAAPKLRALVTSRAALQVYGEHELPVEPLPVPVGVDGMDPDELSGYASIALFVDRARAVRPGFRLDGTNAVAVSEIAAVLDGLPLALELAAARVRLLSPQAIRDRLGDRLSLLSGGSRDLPARQQTLRGAIAWSYDLLSPSARMLLRQLGVFMGGFDLEQAEALIEPDSGIEVFDGLAQLVDQNLLRHDDPAGESRLRMLGTIRQFALEQLDAAGEDDDARDRHLGLFLALAEEAGPHLLGAEQVSWLDRLERDHDNLRGALEWAMSRGDAAASDRMLWALWRFWQIRGHLYEGARRGATVLDLPAVDPKLRCRALEAVGGIAYWRGELVDAQAHYVAALDLAREVGDPAILGDALYNASFGTAMSETGGADDLEEGQAYLAEAKQIFEALDDRAGIAKVLWGQGTLVWGAFRGRDVEGALEIYQEASDLYRDLDDVFQYGWSRRMVGRSLLELGRVDEAVGPLREALDVFVSARDASALTLIVNDVALVALKRGDQAGAMRLLGATNALRASSGTDLVRFRSNASEELTRFADSEIPGAAALLAEGGAMSLDELTAYIERSIM